MSFNNDIFNLQPIILAAGQGSRLNAVIPKALIPLGDSTIIGRQINQLIKWGLKDPIVVIGEGGVWTKQKQDHIKKIISKSGKVITNKNSLNSQSTHSLELAIGNGTTQSSYIVIDGDLVINDEILNALSLVKNETAILVKQGYGSSIELEKNGKDGYWLKSVGGYRDSDTIYAGLMRVDSSHVQVFRKLLPEYKDKIMGDFLSEVCRVIPIRAIRLIRDVQGRELYEIADMKGGSYARTNKIVTQDGLTLRKEILAIGKEKLCDEINLLLGLDADIKKHFPEIISYQLNDKPDYLEMKFYTLPTLRQVLFEKRISLREVEEFLGGLLDFTFNKLCRVNITKTPDNFVLDNYLYKTLARLYEAGSRSEKINKLNRLSFLTINGKKYINILPLLRHIKEQGKDFIAQVTPPQLNLIHGDLHFDNILYGEPFILVDPRGWSAGDTAYDIGKLLHSCHGFYDFLHEGKFILKRNESGFIFEVENDNTREIYDGIYQWLMTHITDEELKLRSHFAEAMHFSSVLPFHLSNEKLALACYLTGVIQLNEVYKVDQKAVDIFGEIINVNQADDYKEALSIVEDSNHWY